MQREGKSLLSTVPPPTAAPHHRPSQPSALPPGLSTTATVSQPPRPLSLSLPLPQTPSLAHSSPWLSTMAQPRAARKQSSERLRTTPNPRLARASATSNLILHSFIWATRVACATVPPPRPTALPPPVGPISSPNPAHDGSARPFGHAPTSNLILHSGTRVTRSMCHSALAAPHGASPPRQGVTPGSNPATDGSARPFGRSPTAAPRDELRHSPRRRRYDGGAISAGRHLHTPEAQQ